MATGGSSPGAKTRTLRLSLIVIAIALGLMVALLTRDQEDIAQRPAPEPAPETESPEIAPPGVPEEDPAPPLILPPRAAPQSEPLARLFLVIDDVGNRPEDLDSYLSLDIPITFAVLPQLQFSEESAVRISARGQELILHLPMEAESGKYPGPGTIYVGDSQGKIDETLRANLRTVPGAKGINNHMGSKATADRETMNAALEFARREGLFFLDSRTTHNTVALEVARDKKVPAAERHVFLDNVREIGAIREALTQGVALAREQGYAVLIGHATSPELALVLREEGAAIKEAGIRFHHLSALFGTEYVGSRD